MDQFSLQSVLEDGIRIVRLSGPFTLNHIWEFQTLCRAITEPLMIIDLTEVPYMDSASLGAVLGVHVSRERLHRKYAVIGASERLETLFTVAGVHKMLVRYPTFEPALAALKS